MSKNRLNLNFQLESAADRAEYVNTYMAALPFEPSAAELETISNYILWGKTDSGKNLQQEKVIELKKWTADPVESLEGLLEQPGFLEANLRKPNEPQTRIPRTVFNRTKVLEAAPEHLKSVYEDLFRRIDTIELTLNYYELFTGKRKLPPRENLLNKFTEQEQIALNERALKLTQFKYLKMKHLLVELRSEQYTYYDMHNDKVQPHIESQEPIYMEEQLRIGEDVSVLPVGLNDESGLASKIFVLPYPEPGKMTEEEQWALTHRLWDKPRKLIIDFTNEAHVLNLYIQRADLMDASAEDPGQIYGAAGAVVNTLIYYEECANLTPLQKDLLELKLRKVSNLNIAAMLNEKYNKSYNENYISTIYRQKIIPQITGAAKAHREILENLFFPENFKRCRDCGRMILMSPRYFMRQAKAPDGYAPRCKECDKIRRAKRDETNRQIAEKHNKT